MEYFRDKHGITITPGCVIKFETLVKTGERASGRGRNKTHFSIRENKELRGVVRFGVYKTVLENTLITYYIEIPDFEEYDTHFFSGTGWSRRERARNELVTVRHSLSRPLTAEIAAACEIIGVEEAAPDNKLHARN